MTTLTANASRIDHFFRNFIGFCADFCAGARQGGYPASSPPVPLTGRRH